MKKKRKSLVETPSATKKREKREDKINGIIYWIVLLSVYGFIGYCIYQFIRIIIFRMTM